MRQRKVKLRLKATSADFADGLFQRIDIAGAQKIGQAVDHGFVQIIYPKRQQAADDRFGKTKLDDPGRIAAHNRIRGNVFRYYASGRNHRTFAKASSRHDHTAHADPYRIFDLGIALALIALDNFIHKRIVGKPVVAVRIIAAHQNNAFGTDANIIADLQAVDRPLRLPMGAAVAVTVMVTDNRFFKTAAPGIAVITSGTFDDNVGVGNRLMQVLDPRPVFFHFRTPLRPA